MEVHVYSNEELTVMNLETSRRFSMALSTQEKKGASRPRQRKGPADPGKERGEQKHGPKDGSKAILGH